MMKFKNIVFVFVFLYNSSAFSQSSDLSVQINVHGNSFFAGERSSFSVIARNNGPENASNIQFDIEINSPVPIENLTINNEGANCQINNNSVLCQHNALQTGQNKGINVSFIPNTSPEDNYSIQVSATVSSNNPDPKPNNNSIVKLIQIKSAPSQQEWGDALINALGDDAERLNQMVRALAAYCGSGDNFMSGMGGNCDNLFIEALNGNTSIIKRVLRRLRPREVVQQGRTSVEIIATQQANIASRMAQLRAGSGNSFAGLTLSSGSQSLPVEMLSYLSKDNNTSYNDFVSPWGFFMNGQLSSGDYSYADAENEGFDFNTDGITMGVDYRLNSKSVVGAALGYANFNSQVDQDATMNSSSLTYSAYGSYNFNENFYLDARLSYGQPKFDQERSIQFNMNGDQTDLSALGKTQGKQRSFILSGGYQFNFKGWQFTPSMSAELYKTEIDAFVETGARAFNVGFSQQNFKTNRYTFGVQLNRNISLKNGVLIPALGYELINENQNGNEFILMRISGMPEGEFFEVASNFNDSNYSSANASLTFVSANGKQFYLRYSEVFGWQGFNRYTLNIGARFEF